MFHSFMCILFGSQISLSFMNACETGLQMAYKSLNILNKINACLIENTNPIINILLKIFKFKKFRNKH